MLFMCFFYFGGVSRGREVPVSHLLLLLLLLFSGFCCSIAFLPRGAGSNS